MAKSFQISVVAPTLSVTDATPEQCHRSSFGRQHWAELIMDISKRNCCRCCRKGLILWCLAMKHRSRIRMPADTGLCACFAALAAARPPQGSWVFWLRMKLLLSRMQRKQSLPDSWIWQRKHGWTPSVLRRERQTALVWRNVQRPCWVGIALWRLWVRFQA